MDSDGVAGPSSEPGRHRPTIKAGDALLLKLPSGVVRQVQNLAEKSNVSLGKFGSFMGGQLVGQPFGLTYEIEDGKIRAVLGTTVSELFDTNVDDVEANNQFIRDKAGAQKLTFLDIEALKKDGVSGRAMIQKQISEHAAFDQKTEFAKEKYIRRKESKYLKMFTVLEPTIHTVCQFLFETNPQAIRGLRPDALSQMMCAANVRPGWRGLVVEDVGGLVVGAVLERLGGVGEVVVINDADSPPDVHLLKHLNLCDDLMAPLKSLNWAQTDETWTAPEIELPEPSPGPTKPLKGQHRHKRRKAKQDELEDVRRILWAGEFEALIVCSQYAGLSIIQRVTPFLGGSASIVVQSPMLDPLASIQHSLRASPEHVFVTVSEPWLRRYQVLPGRTHPEMNGMAGGGYLLTAVRVIPDSSVQAPRKRKR